jgi:acyl carrier protein
VEALRATILAHVTPTTKIVPSSSPTAEPLRAILRSLGEPALRPPKAKLPELFITGVQDSISCPRWPACRGRTTIMTMGQEITSKVRRIIGHQFTLAEDRIKPESSFVDDFGADSLSLVQMTLRLEETFDIRIDVEDVEKIFTVQNAIDYVEKQVAERG